MEIIPPSYSSSSSFNTSTLSGVGLGLRHQHFQEFIDDTPAIPWLEVHTENFMYFGSTPAKHLERIREDYPISMHCIGMSLGTDYHNNEAFTTHLTKLKITIDFFEPQLVSDHLSWSGVENQHFVPDLLPLPYTEEALSIIVNNIQQAQEFLGRQILVENPSSYLSYNFDAMTEWDFLIEVAKRSGCGLLFDLNNIYVSSHNHGFDAKHYLNQIPTELVQEIHLAGYDVNDVEGREVFIDTHGNRVYDDVWDLYRLAIERFGDVPTLIEWDSDVPELSVLIEEKDKADNIRSQQLSEVA